jgi:hypothetical protein
VRVRGLDRELTAKLGTGITKLFGAAWYRREPTMTPTLQWKGLGGWNLTVQGD